MKEYRIKEKIGILYKALQKEKDWYMLCALSEKINYFETMISEIKHAEAKEKVEKLLND